MPKTQLFAGLGLVAILTVQLAVLAYAQKPSSTNSPPVPNDQLMRRALPPPPLVRNNSPPKTKYTLFLPDGTPVRATTTLKLKEAGKLSNKKESGEAKKKEP